MTRYAQIDEYGVCFAVSDLAGPVEGPALIGLAADEFPIGYTLLDGEWIAPPPPPPPAVPIPLTHLQFVEHAQAAGEMTHFGLVAAKLDANLAAFWIKFELATSLERDHPTTVQGLAALVATGHLTEVGREAIVELWPTS